MKVSVIVPVYNARDYIEKCLDSLISQTLKDIEIIVIDDGSTDDTYKILSKYKDKIKLIRQKNGGVANARNKGLSIAKGEYIAFVDSDDWVEFDMFYKLYNKAIENKYDAVECDFRYVDEYKEWQGVTDIDKDVVTLNDKKKYFIKMFPVIWNKIYKRDKIVNIKFKDGVWAEDVEFLYRVITKIDTIGKVNEELYYYYQREKSESRLFDKRVYSYIDNFNGIIEYYKRNKIYDLYKNELEFCYVRYIYATFIKRAASFKNKEDYNVAVETAIKNVKEKFPKYRKNKYFYQSVKGIYLVIFNKFIAILLNKKYNKG